MACLMATALGQHRRLGGSRGLLGRRRGPRAQAWPAALAGDRLGSRDDLLGGDQLLGRSRPWPQPAWTDCLAWSLGRLPLGVADLAGVGLRALSLRTAALLAGFCVALLPEVFFRAMSLVSLVTSGCNFSITHATLSAIGASVRTLPGSPTRVAARFYPSSVTGPGLLRPHLCPSRLCCMAWLPKTAHRHTRTSVCQMAPLRSDTAYFADLSSDFVQAVTTKKHHNTNFTHFEGSGRKEHTPWHARCLNARDDGPEY